MVGVGGILCLRIGRWGLWAGEALSVSTSDRSLESLVRSFRQNPSGATYALLLNGWIRLGRSEAWLRTLSLIFIVATIPVLFALGRRVFSVRAAWISVAMFVLNATVLLQGQQVQYLGLTTFLAAAFSYAFFRDSTRIGGRRSPWGAVWACLGVALVATQMASALFVGAHILGALVRRERRVARITALALPSFLLTTGLVLHQLRRRDFWLASTNGWRSTFAEVARLLAGRATLGASCVALAGIVLIGLLAISGRSAKDERTGSRLAEVGLWVAIALIGLCVVATQTPTALEVVPSFVLAPLALWCGGAVHGALTSANTRGESRKLLAIAGTIMVCVGQAWGLARWHCGTGVADWKTLCGSVFAQAKPGDGVVFVNPANRHFCEYYREKAQLNPLPVWPIDSWGGFDPDRRRLATIPPSAIERARDTTQRLFVVVGRGESDGGTLRALDGWHPNRETRTSAGVVFEYDVLTQPVSRSSDQ